MGEYEKYVTEYFGYDKVLPNEFQDAEGDETALKLCRKWAYKVKGIKGEAKIIVCDGNFHGRYNYYCFYEHRS